MAVLVRAGVWVKAVWDSVLEGVEEWDRHGGGVRGGVSQTKL